MTNKKGSRLYSFEDYKILYLGNDDFLFGYYSPILPYSYDKSAVTFLTVDNSLTATVIDDCGVVFRPCLYENHPDLLDTAKKVYVHPSCKLSRSMMAEKYGKCINPWVADAVVVPTPPDRSVVMKYMVLFCNDAAKLIVMVNIKDELNKALASIFQIGKTYETLCKSIPTCIHSDDYKFDDLLKSEFFFSGKVLIIPNNQSYILDALTRNLPISKTVFEESVQRSLSTEDNQLSLEALINIHDMLNSSDANTVGAGLKALSMMDYIHYPNSVRYIIKHLNNINYRYNKAANSTSVKFMFKQLCPETAIRRYWPGDYDSTIYEKDYDLFLQLIKHYEPAYKDNVLARIMNMNFMASDNLRVIPCFRQ